MTLAKISLAAFGAVLASVPAMAADLPDLDGREITIVTENAYPPLQFIDRETGDAIGWEYDAIDLLAEKLNFTPVYENISWDAMIPAVSEGQYDLGMTGITIRDDRREKVDFSAPYMLSEMLMVVRADEDRFDDAASFAANEDLLIAAQPGTTPFYVSIYDILDGDESNPRMRLFETFGATVQALMADDVDLILSDSTAAHGYVAANEGRLKIVGEPLGSEEFGFIFPKESELVAPFDAAIAALQDEGAFDALNEYWFFEYKMGE